MELIKQKGVEHFSREDLGVFLQQVFSRLQVIFSTIADLDNEELIPKLTDVGCDYCEVLKSRTSDICKDIENKVGKIDLKIDFNGMIIGVEVKAEQGGLKKPVLRVV